MDAPAAATATSAPESSARARETRLARRCPFELLAFGASFGLWIAAAPYELTRFYSMREERIDAVEVGVVTSLVLLVVVSWLGRPPPEESLDAFFSDGAG